MGTRIEALDRKAGDIRRPALAGGGRGAAAPQGRLGLCPPGRRRRAAHGLDSIEAKGLNTAVAAEGGFLVDPKTAETIEHVLRSGASLRALSRVVQVEASAYDVLVNHNDIGADWQAETATITETTAPIVERISIPLHELSASPTASQRLLDDTAFDVEAWLAERIAERFLRRRVGGLRLGRRHQQADRLPDQDLRAERDLDLGQYRVHRHRHLGRFRPEQPRRRAGRSGLRAECRVPRRRGLRDELAHRGRGPQDEGQPGPVPVDGRAAGRPAAAAGRAIRC